MHMRQIYCSADDLWPVVCVRMRPFPSCSLRGVARYLSVCMCEYPVNIVCIHIYSYACRQLAYFHPLSISVPPVLLSAHAYEYACMNTFIHKMLCSGTNDTSYPLQVILVILPDNTYTKHSVRREPQRRHPDWPGMPIYFVYFLQSCCLPQEHEQREKDEARVYPRLQPSSVQAGDVQGGVWVAAAKLRCNSGSSKIDSESVTPGRERDDHVSQSISLAQVKFESVY